MDYNLESIHDKCGWNENDIKNSKRCGCFYCLNIFSPGEIDKWVDEDPQCPRGPGKTALCPNCSIDSVLPDNIGYEINLDLLKAMKLKYF